MINSIRSLSRLCHPKIRVRTASRQLHISRRPWEVKELCTLAIFLISSHAFAQNHIELLSISGQYSPGNAVENTPASADISNGIVNAKLPIVFQEGKNIWYNDISYLYSDISTNSITSLGGYNLQGIILQTGLVHRFDTDHAMQLLLAPRLMSSASWRITDFQPGLIAMFEKRYNPQLLMRYGILYNQDLFGPMLIPLVYLYYQKEKSPWSFKALLPINSQITYQLNSNWKAGFKHFGLITSYPLKNHSYLERKSIDLSLFVQYRLYQNIHIELRGGYALDRAFARYDSNDQLDMRMAVFKFGEERMQLNPGIADGFFTGLRFFYLMELE